MIKLKYLLQIVTVLLLTICFSISRLTAYVDEIRITPVVKAVEKAKTAVVNISTHEQVYERTNPFSGFGRDPFFDRFFNDFFDYGYQRKSVRTHLGSGVIIDSRGYVLTNWHVIKNSPELAVVFKPARGVELRKDLAFAARVVKFDEVTDLALLQIKKGPRDLSTLNLGNKSSI